MKDLLPFLIIGVVSGSLYGLAGAGLVLTYRTSGIFNFGHGAMAAGGAFLFYTLHYTHHMPWPFAAALTLALFAAIGGFLLEGLTRSLSSLPEAAIIVCTIGILLIVEGFLYLQYGNTYRSFPNFLPTSGFTLSGVLVSWAQVITFVIATVGSLLLYVLMKRTRLGVAMRAVVDNPTLVALGGDRPQRIRFTAWAIGSAFAALSGILIVPTVGLDPNLLTFLIIQAFGACAIGLFRSLPLTYAGGIVVGVAASVATKYFTNPPLNGVPSSIPFFILVAVLLIIPVRRIPRSRGSIGALTTVAKPMPRNLAAAVVTTVLLGLIVVPHVVGTHLPVWTAAVILVIAFASLGLLVWVSGQISLCHAAFLAIGASTMSHLHHHVPWAIALLLSGLIAVPVGALVAIPAIRLPGIYLALATLGFGVLMQYVFYPTSFMFTRSLTVATTRHLLGPFNGRNDTQFFYLVLVIAAVALAAVYVVIRTRLGRVLRAMAETPTMLVTNGLNVNASKLIVFSMSAFLAAISGALAVTQYGSSSVVQYGPLESLLLLAVLAICGTQVLRGSVLAATLFGILPGYLSGFGTNQQTFAFGALALVASLILGKRESISALLSRRGDRTAATTRRPLFAPRLSVPRASQTRMPLGMTR